MNDSIFDPSAKPMTKSNELKEFFNSTAKTTSPQSITTIGQAPKPAFPNDCLSSSNAKLWAISGNAYVPCEESVSQLPSGHYIVNSDPNRGLFFQKRDFSIDDLVDFPDSNSKAVITQIEQFWNLKEHFRNYGFLWKRGILLWGPPGSGKTSTVQIIAQKIIERNGIAVSVYNPLLTAAGLHILRRIEPERPVLGLIEDIDAIIHDWGESDLLALLDGENQIDNIVYLATTNYPQNLDLRFVNRPSRFDIIAKIGMPNENARRMYFKAKSKSIDSSAIEKWVKDTDGFSMAHLKEMLISVEVFGNAYDDVLDRLNAMINNKDENHNFESNYKTKISGFGND